MKLDNLTRRPPEETQRHRREDTKRHVHPALKKSFFIVVDVVLYFTMIEAGIEPCCVQAGLVEGILVLAFVAYFAYRAMLLLIDCKYKVFYIYIYSSVKSWSGN